MPVHPSLIVATLTIAMGGCANKQASSAPIASTTGSILVRIGSVTDVRDVTIQDCAASHDGILIGSMLGDVVSSQFRQGSGRLIAGIGGAAIGNITAHQIAQPTCTKGLTEVKIRFENGEERIYPIEPPEKFRVGEQVKVITAAGHSRLSR